MVDLAMIQANLLNIVVNLVIGLAVLVIGYGIAVIVETILKKAFARAQVEEKMKELNLNNALMGFTLTGLITGLVKWIVFLWFLASAVGIIETSFLALNVGSTPVLTNFLTGFVAFLPVLLQGIIILMAGFLLADFLAGKIRKGFKHNSKAISGGVKVLVIYFTIVIALSNPAYGINIGIITTIFNYLILAVAFGIGGGLALALGLGLKDSIGRVSKKNESRIERLLFK